MRERNLMKLLLTSTGITTKSIADALSELVKKPLTETRICVVITASLAEEGDKTWLIRELEYIKRRKFQSIDIIDLCGASMDHISTSFESSDVIFFNGGSESHLVRCIRELDLEDYLNELFQTRVYAGSSAGSIISGKYFPVRFIQQAYGESLAETEDIEGLGYVDLSIIPHYYSSFFPERTEENLKLLTQSVPKPAYAIDDKTALKIDGSRIEVISDGRYVIVE
jgi:dipeptidase E